jgi:hypothetical protein
MKNFRVTISRRMQWVGHVADIREMRNAYNILVEKPVGKRLHWNLRGIRG